MTDFGTADDQANTMAFPGQAGTFLMHHAKTIHWAGPTAPAPAHAKRWVSFITPKEQSWMRQSGTPISARWTSTLQIPQKSEPRKVQCIHFVRSAGIVANRDDSRIRGARTADTKLFRANSGFSFYIDMLSDSFE